MQIAGKSQIFSFCCACFVLPFTLFFSEQPSLYKYLSSIQIGNIKPCRISKIDTIFIINLANRPNKLRHVSNTLSQYDLEYNRIEAINGWGIKRRALNNFRKECLGKPGAHLNPGHIGCMLSHLSILKYAQEQDFSVIWVMEDDALVLKEPGILAEYLEELEALDPDWEVLYTDRDSKLTDSKYLKFEAVLPRSKFDYSLIEDKNFIPISNEHFERIQYRLATHSMVISRKGIAHLLGMCSSNRICFPYDVEIQRLQSKHFYRLKEDLVTAKVGFPSDSAQRRL